MRENEFIKKFGYVDSKRYIDNAHKKATHIYTGFMGTASYFYQHPSLNWCEVDSRTIGWDSDRCCYGVHPPISSMFAIEELKRLVESHELVEEYNGLFEAKELIRVSPKMTSELRELVAAIADVESCL